MVQKPYKERLREIYHSHTVAFTGDFASDDVMVRMTEMFQAEYPGNYTLEESYIPDTFQWGLRIVFNSPEEETWFKLQHV